MCFSYLLPLQCPPPCCFLLFVLPSLEVEVSFTPWSYKDVCVCLVLWCWVAPWKIKNLKKPLQDWELRLYTPHFWGRAGPAYVCLVPGTPRPPSWLGATASPVIQLNKPPCKMGRCLLVYFISDRLHVRTHTCTRTLMYNIPNANSFVFLFFLI